MTQIQKDKIIRAWRDSEYRAHLSTIKKTIPQHPAGSSELSIKENSLAATLADYTCQSTALKITCC